MISIIKPKSPIQKTIPLDMVGGTQFGRYPKISVEQTWNMIESDEFLVPFAGHRSVAQFISGSQQGRGIFASTKFNHLIAVVSNSLFIVDSSLGVSKIATLKSDVGDVFIAENNANQIALTDKENIYVFNYSSGAFNTLTAEELGFIPGYISFQDSYFIAPDLTPGNPQWRLSDPNNGLSWPAGAPNVGTFETKANTPQACIPVPGKGNMLFVMGQIVSETWYDLGYQLFPYQRNSFYNIDFGVLNPATIDYNEEMVVWLGINDKSGPVILVSTGGAPQQISNDGINFKLANLASPQDSYGFLFKQDGHLFYQLTFPTDNLTYVYDFNTQKFFCLSDEYMNYHIAKRVAFFNNKYYFVSFNDGNLYELSSQFTTYNGAEIPRIRITKPIRLPDSSPFCVNNHSFIMEQGDANSIQAIDLSMSKDGGVNFSNIYRLNNFPAGMRRNRINFWNMGRANDYTPQFRFWGTGRFVVGNGVTSIYQ
jgi:hypothetical protein